MAGGNIMYYILDDLYTNIREGFIVNEDELNSYPDRFVIIRIFDSEESANEFAEKYNAYELEDDEKVRCSCCTEGCTMSAFEYAHWNGLCAYSGK